MNYTTEEEICLEKIANAKTENLEVGFVTEVCSLNMNNTEGKK